MARVSAVDWLYLAQGAVQVGDIVSADAGGMPLYRVLALADGQAWLRDEAHPDRQLMALDGLCWKAERA